jgi:hypothetical protein
MVGDNMSNKKLKKRESKIQFKFDKKKDPIIIGIVILIALAIILSPNMYWITTAKWTNWNEQDNKNVVTAM